MDISAYLPVAAGIINDFPLAREVKGKNNEFCSCAGRKDSLAVAAFGFFLLVAGPVFTCSDVCKSKVCFGWKIVDFVACLALGVLLGIALIIKGLFGAIFHPGVVFKSGNDAPPSPYQPDYTK